MSTQPVEIDAQVMRTGLKRAMARGQEAVLCVLGPTSVRYISTSDTRMVVSWEHPITGPAAPQFYVFPSLVMQFLISRPCQELKMTTLGRSGKNMVLTIMDECGRYEMRWQAEFDRFPAPPEFNQMMAVPKGLITIRYLNLSDAAHQAVAHLVNMQSMRNIPTDKLAILMDFRSGSLMLDGQPIVRGASGAYYFDPRLIIRARELFKSNTLRVGITPLPAGHRAVLSILADHEGWRVQCGLLSVGAETEKLYPAPPPELVISRP